MRGLKVLLIVVLLVFGIGVGSAAAAPVAATTSVPYVWVRAAPSSYASVVYTVYPTSYATLQTTGNTQWDGYQTWAEVTVIANGGIRGWVEQGSLVSATTAGSGWQVNVQAVPQAGVPTQANVPYRTANTPVSFQQALPGNPGR